VKSFLVMRGPDGQLRSILVFDGDDPQALAAYANAEARGIDCVLLGADNLSTVIQTNPGWFDEQPTFEL
jgi:hypothetical protein